MTTQELLIGTIKNFSSDKSLSKPDKEFMKNKLELLQDCISKKEKDIINPVLESLNKGRLNIDDKNIIFDSKKIIIKIINNYGEQFNEEPNENDIDEENDTEKEPDDIEAIVD